MMKEFENSDLKLINSLIADPNFEKLQTFNQSVNSFHLNYASEMDHSRMIQWILNPNESHNLGTMPLKTLLNACWNTVLDLEEKPDFFKSDDVTVTPVTISQMSMESVISFTEHTTDKYGRIDILIIFPDANIAIIIENKYGAGETKGQLAKYREWGKKKLDGFSVLYLYMDGLEKWPGEPDKQWVKISYDWLIDTLSTAVEKPHISERIKNILSDYHDELTRDCLSTDGFYATVREQYHDFSKKHSKALSVLTEHILPSLENTDYLNEIQKSWSNNLRIMHWYLLNEDVINLLQESSVNEDLQDFIESNTNGLTFEYSNKYLRLHHEKWHELQKNRDGRWCIFLLFQNTKVAGNENQKETTHKFDFQLNFNFENHNEEKLSLLSAIWEKYAGKRTLKKENLGKTKTLHLANNIPHEKDDVLNIVRKYIKEINALF